jgi:hypothetical protein
MASAQEKAGVVWFSAFRSIVRVQREFLRVYQKATPNGKVQSMAQQVSGYWKRLERAWRPTMWLQ